MDDDAFTLTGLAFPVAPANLDGFTLDSFQWPVLEPAEPEVMRRQQEPAVWGYVERVAEWGY